MRFNGSKLLIDPYAKALTARPKNIGNLLLAYDPEAPEKDLSRDGRDNSRVVPKSIVVDDVFDWRGDDPPDIPLEKLVIYEVHLKGFTAHPSSRAAAPGTYLGFIEKIPHLVELGINAVELLPVQQYCVEDFLEARGLTNSWGYNTIGFFAPEVAYGSGRFPPCQGGGVKKLPRGPPPPRGHPAGDGFATLLGRDDACRRLPVRPRLGAGTGGGDVPRLGLLLRRDLPGPRAPAGEADRRAVGPGDVPGRQLPGRLVGGERAGPGHRPEVRQGRRWPGAGPRVAADRLRRPVRGRRALRLPQHQLRHLPRRLHPARHRLGQPPAKRGEHRGEPGRNRRQQLVEQRAGRGQDLDAVPDIAWYGEDLAPPAWDDPEARLLCCRLDGGEEPSAAGKYHLFVILNADYRIRTVRVPPLPAGRGGGGGRETGP